MNTTQALVGCVLAFFVVDYYHGDDYHRKVLGMALERNHELECEVERLTTLEELAEMKRLLEFRIQSVVTERKTVEKSK